MVVCVFICRNIYIQDWQCAASDWRHAPLYCTPTSSWELRIDFSLKLLQLADCAIVQRWIDTQAKHSFKTNGSIFLFFFTFLVVAMRPLVLHRRIIRPLMRSRVCTCLLLIDDVFVEFSCSHERMISYILIYHLGVKWINTVL